MYIQILTQILLASYYVIPQQPNNTIKKNAGGNSRRRPGCPAEAGRPVPSLKPMRIAGAKRAAATRIKCLQHKTQRFTKLPTWRELVTKCLARCLVLSARVVGPAPQEPLELDQQLSVARFEAGREVDIDVRSVRSVR